MKNAFGWLPGNRHFWSAGPGCGGAAFYAYGWPAGGSAESDVAAQWIFDEGSGNIVDEVASLSLPATNAPIYNQSASGQWTNLGPGIDMNSTGSFGVGVATAQVEPGTSDFTLEWIHLVNTLTPNDMIYMTGGSGGTGGMQLYWDLVTRVTCYMEAQDGTVRYMVVDVPDPRDGDIHKYRMVNTRSANSELFVDGISQGSTNTSGLDGKNIESLCCWICGSNGGGLPTDATMYEFRQSHNATNNSGGPNGG